MNDEIKINDRSKVTSQSSNLTKDTNYSDKNTKLDDEIDNFLSNKIYEQISVDSTNKQKLVNLSENFSSKTIKENLYNLLIYDDDSLKQLKKYENLFNSQKQKWIDL